MTTLPSGAEGPQHEEQPDDERAKAGFFWKEAAPPDEFLSAADAHKWADKSALVAIAKSFLHEMEERAEQMCPLKLGGPISDEEWIAAQSSPQPIISRWFYEDVGCFIAPGGTGKTTLLLFQAIHLVLGLELFGHEVMNPGPVVILTAEDTRETLVARLRQMCTQLLLTPEQIRTVRDEIIITDVSGKGVKLTTVEKDVVVPSKALDKLIVNIGVLNPSMVFIDPMVSFGVGESRVNDAEQGMIDAARRIRNSANCGVLYSHHTGKQNARDRTTDQYSGRGGSALADGCRMVHVLSRLTSEEWTEATGHQLQGDDVGFVLARPKMTWCKLQPDIYIRRHHYVFYLHDHIGGTEGAQRVNQIADDRVWQFLRDEYNKAVKHTQNSLEDAKVLTQRATRQAVKRLLKDGRITIEDLGNSGRGGARHYLRPIEPLVTT